MREHHAVGKDDDVLEAELDGFGDGFEKALVDGGLAAQEGQMGRPGGAGLLERLEDRFERHRARDLHLRQLAARAEDAAIVAEMAELDLEAVPGAGRRDGRGGAPILFRDMDAHWRARW